MSARLFATIVLLGAAACSGTNKQSSDSTTSASSATDSLTATTTTATQPTSDTTPRPPADTSRTRQPPSPPPPVADPLSIPLPDTARGIVKIVGSSPTTALVLTRNDGSSETLSITGAARSLVQNVVGAEVTIIGRQTSDRDLMASPRGAYRFLVDSFFVRASDGIPAHDGILELTNGNYSLRLSNGTRMPITTLPDALRTNVGSRIYIVGPVDKPASWGIIRQ